MHSPAVAWAQSVARAVMELQSRTAIDIAWDYEVNGKALPGDRRSLIRAHGYNEELARSADVIVYVPRDLRDGVLALDVSFKVGATIQIADLIVAAGQCWERDARLTLGYEAILRNPRAAMENIATAIGCRGLRATAILAKVTAQLTDVSGHVAAASYRTQLAPEIIAEIERKHSWWLIDHGYPLTTIDRKLVEMGRALDDVAAMDRELAPGEPRQRFDIRGAVRYLRRELGGRGDRPQQLRDLEQIRCHSENRRALLVAAAEILEEGGDREAAAAKAREALALFYDDVYTQTLFLRCAGERNYFADGRRLFCPRPFRGFEMYEDGAVYACNVTCMPFPIGNALAQDAKQIWQSEVAKKLRASILDGTFQYCAPMTCPSRASLPRRDEQPDGIKELQDIGVEGRVMPKQLNLSYDRSCNVSCPSCRTGLIMASAQDRMRLERIRDNAVIPLLKTATGVYVTGSGDAFGSTHFRGILKTLCRPEYAHVGIILGTNGQLITPRLWQEFALLHHRLREVAISIDGATLQTFERIRRGSSWKRLLETMELLGGARKRGDISWLLVNMVVQESNFMEMRPLIDLCTKWSVDGIRFYRLRQWGHLPPQDFMAADVANPLHPRHGEMMTELAHPVFRSPIVMKFDMYEWIQRAS